MSRWTATMLVLLATPASAATLCVNPAGSGGCFSSIQAAVDASRSRDVIDIAAGTYAETVLLHDVGRLTLQGAGVGATILKGEPVGATIATLGRVDATIVGVEITDGDEGVFVGDGGRLTLRDSSITDNAGAALRTARKTRVTLDGCVVSGNGGSALSFTTATLHSRGNDLAILRSAIVDNQASGVEAANKVTIVDSTIAGHLLVGVSADKGKITGSTVSGNGSTRVRVGVSGSGSGSMQIASATISGNAGTGLFVSPGYGASLSHVTIASNGASGVATTSPRVSLRATILGDNAPSDCDGTLRLARANLIESTAGCSTRGPAPIVGDPLLGPLQDNGGPTEAQAPGVGSAAIGVLTGGCGGVDQRGVPRTKPCDLGAYETP